MAVDAQFLRAITSVFASREVVEHYYPRADYLYATEGAVGTAFAIRELRIR